MPLDDQTPSDLTRLEAEAAKLVGNLQRAESAYAEQKPRYDEARAEYPSAREQEIQMLQGIGKLRDDLQLARAELLHLRGEGPRPKTWVELVDGKMPRNFTAMLAEQSKAEVGPLDQVEL